MFFVQSKKIFLGLVLLVIMVILAILFYTQYQRKLLSPKPNPADQLQTLALKSRDYRSCISQGQEMIKKYPQNKDTWLWKGICEFEDGQFDSAKSSFASVLALDPNQPAAKHYLEILNSGAVLIDVNKGGVNQQEVETSLDFNLDSKILKFEQAFKVPAGGNLPGFATAQYSSLFTFEKTSTYLENLIKTSGIKFTLSKQTDRTSYMMVGQKSSVDYAVTIFKQIPVKVIIDITPKSQ